MEVNEKIKTTLNDNIEKESKIKKENEKKERRQVQHNYHDYALETPHYWEIVTKKTKGSMNDPFPIFLHKMLEKIDGDGLGWVVSWQPHGRSFLVHRKKEFINYVMPKYFQHTKYASFQRQLNVYGFFRISRKGLDRGGYYHELFLRGKPFLCHRMQRMRVKGNGARTAYNPEGEPNFYSMEPISVKFPLLRGKVTSMSTTAKKVDNSSEEECESFPISKNNNNNKKNENISLFTKRECLGNLQKPSSCSYHGGENDLTTRLLKNGDGDTVSKKSSEKDNKIIPYSITTSDKKKHFNHQTKNIFHQEGYSIIEANLKPSDDSKKEIDSRMLLNQKETKKNEFIHYPDEIALIKQEDRVTTHHSLFASHDGSLLGMLPSNNQKKEQDDSERKNQQEETPDDSEDDFPFNLDDLLEKLLKS